MTTDDECPDPEPESIDLGTRYNTHRSLRRWEPGDGLTCSYAARASRSRACGPPVAVRVHTSHPTSTNPRQHREVICAYHLADHANPGSLRVQADQQAREEILVKYWAEYQEAIERHMRPLVERTIGDLPEELKLLVLDALARYDQTTNQEAARDSE